MFQGTAYAYSNRMLEFIHAKVNFHHDADRRLIMVLLDTGAF